MDNTPGDKLGVWRDMRLADALVFFIFCLFVCTVEDISTQDGAMTAIGVKFWLRVEQTSWTGTR